MCCWLYGPAPRPLAHPSAALRAQGRGRGWCFCCGICWMGSAMHQRPVSCSAREHPGNPGGPRGRRRPRCQVLRSAAATRVLRAASVQAASAAHASCCWLQAQPLGCLASAAPLPAADAYGGAGRSEAPASRQHAAAAFPPNARQLLPELLTAALGLCASKQEAWRAVGAQLQSSMQHTSTHPTQRRGGAGLVEVPRADLASRNHEGRPLHSR